MKPLLLILSLILCINANATTYYVSTTDGNDGNSGTAIGSEWKTLSKVNSSMSSFHAGDFILLKRGDTFFGNIMPTVSGSAGSPITFGAYGTGAQPVVTALKTLTFSPSATTNVYTSNSFTPQSNPKLLTLNGVVQQIGRWPNASDVYPYGYLSVDNIVSSKASNYTDITDNTWGSLSKPAGYTTGGELAFRMNHFRFVTYPITTGSMTFSGSSMSVHVPAWLQGAVIGFGYFLQNHPSFLDKNGEWCWNDAPNTGSIYLTSSPASATIEMPALDDIIVTGGRSYLTFKDIEFRGANRYGFNISGGSNITVQNCTGKYFGNVGIKFSNVANLQVLNSTVDGAFVYGISGSGDGAATISGNTVQHIFPILGMGNGGNVAGTGVIVSGSNKTVYHNYFKDMGYAGVVFSNGSNLLIEKNIVDGPNQRIDDGGALYTDNHNQQFQYSNVVVRQNIIKNVETTTAYRGTMSTGTDYLIYSLYADQWTKNSTWDGNIVKDGKLGWYANDPLSNTIKNNFFYNQRQRNIEIRNKHTDYPISGNSFTNNVMFSTLSGGNTGVVANNLTGATISGYGVMNNNYYIRPYRGGNFFTATINGVTNGYTMPGWTALYGFEANSHLSPLSFTTQNPAGYTRFHCNESDTARTYFLGAGTEWYTSRGAIITNEHITLQPFTAEGLILKSGPAMNDPDPDGNVSVDPNQPPPPPPTTPEGVIKIKSKYKIIHVQ